ncbi:GNAT family N-acetyltransferase [Streptomyces sp. ODS05-4]|uniref:GNAT family N-acetyltransferase n=1 Tax=Streptomyces sp. ODS05-4 TaxID=2944939 RepID=UPI00210D0649|nr:GNAT family N-acetyltransferase [Streptomyces sp. ODS05-4]
MTTTLRPAGPLQQTADGTRTRPYEVCVNSRPVGTVDLGTSPVFGPSVGQIRDLRIAEPDRRRGRGTVAALAAEEVLRAWRCTRVDVTVPADAAAARRLAEALGYAERGRSMVKPLPEEPPALPDAGIRPMTDAEFADFVPSAVEGYASDLAARGVPEEQARFRSEESHRELLPDGLATEGAGLFTAADARGRAIGWLWTGRRDLPGEGRTGYVWSIEVAERARGRGVGRALMRVAEQAVHADGARRIGLHVFSDNVPARRLYESLGYEVTQLHCHKPLV